MEGWNVGMLVFKDTQVVLSYSSTEDEKEGPQIIMMVMICADFI